MGCMVKRCEAEKILDPYRIILADDHVPLRRKLKSILGGVAGFEVIGEAGDGIELINLLNEKGLEPHIVLIDASMPNLSGIEAARAIKMNYPGIKVLILSVHEEREYLQQAFSAGAEGYLLKADADMELFTAIETVRQGGIYISPTFSGPAQKNEHRSGTE